MISFRVLTKEEKKLLDEKHEKEMQLILEKRSGAYQRGILLSEVTGRRDHKVEAHHILGRGIPDGFQRAPDVIKKFWPHVPAGCVLLTEAEHRHAEGNPKMMRPLLLRWVETEYAEEVWQGLTYPEVLNQPPFREWLRR